MTPHEHNVEKEIRCPVHNMPRTPDTWMAACTCPSTAHGIEEGD